MNQNRGLSGATLSLILVGDVLVGRGSIGLYDFRALYCKLCTVLFGLRFMNCLNPATRQSLSELPQGPLPRPPQDPKSGTPNPGF